MNIKINNKRNIGENDPCFIIAEIGINHNGSLEIAKKLIDVASDAGCDSVKIQKRNPDICVPEHQKGIIRETPWGQMTYLDYKKKIEFKTDDCLKLKEYAEKKGLIFFASCWDADSVNEMNKINIDLFKIASASITDSNLLKAISKTKKPVIISTGMSTLQEIETAISYFDKSRIAILHTVSSYPSDNDEIDLNIMLSYKKKYNTVIGYSGHEKGLQISIAAAALGAKVLERHITLDRSMWGTDQSASLEPRGLKELVRDVRIIEKCLGNGEKKILESEIPIRKKLRGD
jgi:N-acetylneuraminate synthase